MKSNCGPGVKRVASLSPHPFVLATAMAVAAACQSPAPKKSDDTKAASTSKKAETPPPAKAEPEDTCAGLYPSYWQDPKFPDQWKGQQISNAPPEGWKGPVFRLSDKYPTKLVDDASDQPWRDAKYDALFKPETPTEARKKLAYDYGWAVMNYMQEGNINQAGQEDWAVCKNPKRPWYNVPFQTYDPLSGREFTHGLTREAPVTFSVQSQDKAVKSTMWAVGFFNHQAAYALGQVWKGGKATSPTKDLSFPEGSVVGKPLFNTANVTQLPILEGLPAWKANISAPDFCSCPNCDLVQDSKMCPRSTTEYQPVRLLQFDFSVKDSRAPSTAWVYGTFVADGQRKTAEKEPEPWNRISLLGVMWGNDTPPTGKLAYDTPPDPRKNGFQEEIIFWDVVDALNAAGGKVTYQQAGHLGCNQRLNGPADNANSSCMSCHGTASVPDENLVTPPLLSQFGKDLTYQCVTPGPSKTKGKDRTDAEATVHNGVSFADMDSIYFANTPGAKPFNAIVETKKGPVNVFGEGVPDYGEGGPKEWISLDYSMQLSISLTQWGQWQQHKAAEKAEGHRYPEVLQRGQ